MIRSALLALTLSGCAWVAGLDDFDLSGAAGGGGASVGGAGGEGAGPAGGASPCADDLLISEIRTYGTGRGDDDFVEIVNPTTRTISLADISIAARAPSSALMERWRGNASEKLPPGEHYLIAGVGFDDVGVEPDDQLGEFASLGNDVIVLLRRGPLDNSTVIDIACICTASCTTSEWDGCQGVVLDNPAIVAGEPVDTDDSQQRFPQCEDSDRPGDFQRGPSTPREENFVP